MTRRTCWFLMVVTLWLASASTAAADIDRLVIFGDSLSDVGNIDIATLGFQPGSGYSDGRFSNGPVWVEALATELGVPAPQHSRSGFLGLGTNPNGYDFAHGGATTGTGSGVIRNIGEQLSRYDDNHDPEPNDLFILWGGANDFFNGQTNPAVPVNNLAGYITSLAGDDATQFLVPNLPPLGQTPDNRGTANEIPYDNLAVQFNTLLDTTLDNLETTLGVTIYRLDVFDIFQDLLADPAAYGFTNVTDPAMSSGPGGGEVANPDQYLFWDGVHPTEVAHAMLGELAAQALSPPAIPGDFDGDGDVDLDDYNILSGHMYQTGLTPEQGDADGDGDADFEDFVIFALHFNAPAAESAPDILPEPAVGVLVLVAWLVCPRRCRKRTAGIAESAEIAENIAR